MASTMRKGGQRAKTVLAMGGRDSLPTGPSAPVNRRYSDKLFGQIISINNGFGFLQPYEEKEQAYYNQRDTPVGLEIGTEVAFLLQRGPRGLSAVAIQIIAPASVVTTPAVRGIISAAPDGSRCPVGHIDVSPMKGTDGKEGASTSDENRNLQRAVYVGTPNKRGSGYNSASAPLTVGDEVEFTLNTIPGSSYVRATDVKLIQTRRERKRKEKIAELIAAGAVEEQGIIETINRGDFGFIKCADRTGSLYFNMSDMMTDEKLEEVRNCLIRLDMLLFV